MWLNFKEDMIYHTLRLFLVPIPSLHQQAFLLITTSSRQKMELLSVEAGQLVSLNWSEANFGLITQPYSPQTLRGTIWNISTIVL